MTSRDSLRPAASLRTRSAGTRPRRPAARLPRLIRRCQACGSVEEERGLSRRAARPGVASCVLERSRDGFVGGSAGCGELPCPRLGILEQLGEPRMHLCTPPGVGALESARGEERVREPDPLAVDLDHARLECRRESDRRAMPEAVSVIATVGWACAAAAIRKSRLSGGSASKRPWTRSCSESGTGTGCPASTEVPVRVSVARSRGRRTGCLPRPVHLREERARESVPGEH